VSRRYLTRARLMALRSQLSTGNIAIMSDVARLHVVSGQQLRRLHYADGPSGRRLARFDLKRLTDQQLLSRLERRVGGQRAGSDGYVYALDIAGQRLIDPGQSRYRRPWTPGTKFLSHSLAISELYVRIKEASKGTGHLETFDAEPACWRVFHGLGGQRQLLKPDAYVVTVSERYEDHWFVEVDLATEDSTKLLLKAKSYVRYWQSGREQARIGLFPRVIWIVPDKHRAQAVGNALSKLSAEGWQLFAITTAERAVDQLLGNVPQAEAAS
jgi:hypothetical protein